MTSLADAQRIRDLEERVRVLEVQVTQMDDDAERMWGSLGVRLAALEAATPEPPVASPAKPKRAVPPAFVRWQEQQRKAKEDDLALQQKAQEAALDA